MELLFFLCRHHVELLLLPPPRATSAEPIRGTRAGEAARPVAASGDGWTEQPRRRHRSSWPPDREGGRIQKWRRGKIEIKSTQIDAKLKQKSSQIQAKNSMARWLDPNRRRHAPSAREGEVKKTKSRTSRRRCARPEAAPTVSSSSSPFLQSAHGRSPAAPPNRAWPPQVGAEKGSSRSPLLGAARNQGVTRTGPRREQGSSRSPPPLLGAVCLRERRGGRPPRRELGGEAGVGESEREKREDR